MHLVRDCTNGLMRSIRFVVTTYSNGCKKRCLWLLSMVALFIAGVTAADATYMVAKARLAQSLIERSWNDSGQAPWPWADTAPVARLFVPRLELDTYVLDGATGASLAFGPGMVSGSSKPGQRGVTMIAAHRDTHFRSLEYVKADDVIEVQATDKRWYQYRVLSVGIADSRTDAMPQRNDRPTLVLVTCYPFDSLVTGGPLRFVVEAELI